VEGRERGTEEMLEAKGRGSTRRRARTEEGRMGALGVRVNLDAGTLMTADRPVT
jgi:hypothetical protein